jgi:hypothetical protein
MGGNKEMPEFFRNVTVGFNIYDKIKNVYNVATVE